jgi:hypothetical protein
MRALGQQSGGQGVGEEGVMWWWPGWVSLDSAELGPRFWFWFGIVCAVAVIASQIVSRASSRKVWFWLGIAFGLAVIASQLGKRVYDLRKDELVAAAADAAEARRKADVEAVRKQLSEANKKVADLQIQQAPRHLSPEQQGELIRALSPFAGQKVQLSTIANSNEPKDLALDFVSVFRGAKWDFGNKIDYMMIGGPDPVGLQISVNLQDANNQSAIAPAVDAMAAALVRMGLLPKQMAVVQPGTPVGTIWVIIGVKPPPTAR